LRKRSRGESFRTCESFVAVDPDGKASLLPFIIRWYIIIEINITLIIKDLPPVESEEEKKKYHFD
jgi:hypothetical protein